MTISNQDGRSGPFNGTSSDGGSSGTFTFAYDFKALDQSHLVVTVTTTASGAAVTKTLTTDYTVTGVGNDSGGNVVFVAGKAPLSTETVTITRAVPQTQLTDLQNRGGVQPETLETSFDKLTQISQDISEVQARTVRFPVGSVLTGIEMPLTATAGAALAWNADGDALTNGPTTTAISTAESKAAEAASSAVTAANEASSTAPKYSFSTSTSVADPGAGVARLNNSAAASATILILDDQTADTGNPNVEDWLKTFDDSTSTIKGWIRLVEAGTPANYAIYNVTGITDSSGFIQVAVAHVDSNFASGTTFGASAGLRLFFSRTGDKGDTGSTGSQGPAGSAAGTLEYEFDTSTTDSDPGAGKLRCDHAVALNINNIFIDHQSNAAGNPVVQTFLTTFDDSTSTVKGTLTISAKDTPATQYLIFNVTGITDVGSLTGYTKIAVDHVANAGGIFSAGEDLLVDFRRSGDLGTTGSAGTDGVGGLLYTFSTTTTDSDPGSGRLRLNNGTLGSVSQIFIDDSTAADGNPDVSAFILTWDDSTQTADRGQVTISKKSAQQNFATYKISGASTDASGYVKLAVTHVVSSGSFSNSDAVLVSFARTGNAGVDGGGMTDPMTTRGDVIIKNASNTTARLPVGGANTVLSSDGTDITWGKTIGTSANNIVALNGSGALPAVSGANLTNLPVEDSSSDIRSLALQVAADRVSFGALKGIADPFSDTSDVDLSSSTGESHNTTSKFISGIGSVSNNNYATIDAQSSNNTSYTYRIQVPASEIAASGSLVAVTFRGPQSEPMLLDDVFIGQKADSGNDWDMAGTPVRLTKDGGNSIEMAINTEVTTDTVSCTIDSAKDVIVAFDVTSNTSKDYVSSKATTGFHSWYKTGDPDEAGTQAPSSYTANANNRVGVQDIHITPVGNLALVSNYFSTGTGGSAPTKASITVQVKENESITLNTDLVAQWSFDKSTFQTVTLALANALSVGGTKVYEAKDVTISSAGTYSESNGICYKVSTANTKNVEIHGVALSWS